MGRGFEILVIPLGAIALLSIVAVFAAFFSRAAAKVFAGLSSGLVALFLLVILAENRWDLGWILFLLVEASAPILILYFSLILSAVAVWAPLRRPDSTGLDGSTVPGRPRWLLLALAASVTVGGALHGLSRIAEGRRGEEKAKAMLAGDPNVRLRRFEINYQQRRLTCTDPEVLRYFESRFRSHDPEPANLGTTYEMTLAFEGGGEQSFGTYWEDHGDFNFFIGEAGEGGIGHGIRLIPPRPKTVDEMVRFLAKPSREVAGTVMILEPEGVRTERDMSLIAH